MLRRVARGLVFRVLCTMLFPVMLLVGCGGHGVPVSVYRPSVPVQSLWQVWVEKGGKTVFEGLLAVGASESGREFRLMDSSGIDLMDAVVSKEDKLVISRGIPPLKDGGAGRFLAGSFQMVFTQDISQAPCKCSSLFLRCTCKKELQEGRTGEKSGSSPVSLIKTAWFGPFMVWRITYVLYPGPDSSLRAEYMTLERPWRRFRMYLKRIG